MDRTNIKFSRRLFLGATLGGLGALALPARLCGQRGEERKRQRRQQQKPDLSPFDRLMTGFMKEADVPVAALAVTKDKRLVYAKGFTKPADGQLQPTALFRIASISKPFTATAVLQLVENGKVKLDDPVLPYLRKNPKFRVKLIDPQWDRVTIRQCLQHTAGMDREVSGDPIVMLSQIKQTLGIDYPIPAEAVMRFAIGRKLDFPPGERVAYSNVGYLILGRVIESVSDCTYEEHVRRHVLKPLGIKNMQLARALPRFRPRDEVSYFDRYHQRGPCVYPPDLGHVVPMADGGYNIEGYEAHGGWIASAIDLVRFACAFDDPNACPLLRAGTITTMFERPHLNGNGGELPAAYYGCGWNVRPVQSRGMNTWHDGLLIPGSSTLLVRRHDGLNWAVLFNTDKGVKEDVLANSIDSMVHRAADAVTTWPDTDLFPIYYPERASDAAATPK